MIVCLDGQEPSQSSFDAGVTNLNNAFAEIKAAGLLHENAKLSLQLYYQGVSGTVITNVIPGFRKEVIFDPQFAACLTPNQDMAILLHETGHVHAAFHGELGGYLLDGTAILGLLIGMDRLFAAGKTVFRRSKQKNKKILKNTAIAFTCLGLWSGIGYTNAIRARERESDADLYTAHTMGTPNFMQASLHNLNDLVTLSYGDQEQSLVDTVSQNNVVAFLKMMISAGPMYIAERVGELICYGPASPFIDIHPTITKRIETLEASRPEIEKGNPIIIAKPPASDQAPH